MKTVVFENFGSPDVLVIKETNKPMPGPNQVIIKNIATTVNFGDLMARNFKSVSPKNFNMVFLFWLLAKLFLGVKKPKINVLGNEFSGIVESVGSKVTKFKTGDEVFGYLGQNFGAYSEYFCINENACCLQKPSNLTFAEAASVVYGSIMAISLIKKEYCGPGKKVLIIGATGSIGSAAVQIAKSHGSEIIAVGGDGCEEYVFSLGADKFINYKQCKIEELGEKFDLVVDVLGKSSFNKVKKILSEQGIYLRASFKSKQLLQMMLTSIGKGKKVICALAPGNLRDLNICSELLEKGKIKPIIHKKYQLSETNIAHCFAEQNHHKGAIVIEI